MPTARSTNASPAPGKSARLHRFGETSLHPLAMIGDMEPATTLQFAAAARALTRSARLQGLVAPGFRSPPRLAGVNRSVLRRGSNASIAVRVRGRPWSDVVADMIDGLLIVNGIEGPGAESARAALHAALSDASWGVLPPGKVA